MKALIRSLLPSLAISMVVATSSLAETSTDQPSGSAEIATTPKLDTDIEYKTRTVYEPEFLPGVRLCEEDEVDYRGDFRRVNCQDEAIIEAVSTRQQDDFNTGPNQIVEDRVAPNGNLFRIKFRKKVVAQPKSSDN